MHSKGIILVTGAAGYIGSHIVVELLYHNYAVIALDNLATSYADSKKDLPVSLKRVEEITGKTVTFYNANIVDEECLSNIFQKHRIDCVIHTAALKAVAQSIKDPLTIYKVNVGGTGTLIKVMQDNNVKQILYSSSGAIYGPPHFLPITEEHPVGQACPNPYAKTKYIAEELLKDVTLSDPEWRVMALRYFNPAGAHESGLIGEDPTGIPSIILPYISQVAVGVREKLQIFGADYQTHDGTGVRDYTHITDIALGHIRALERINQPTYRGWQAYNLGAGRQYSILDLINAFSKVSGREIKYEVIGRRAGDIAAQYADVSKAERELNWKPTRDLIDICRDVWNWQSKNPKGYQNSSLI